MINNAKNLLPATNIAKNLLFAFLFLVVVIPIALLRLQQSRPTDLQQEGIRQRTIPKNSFRLIECFPPGSIGYEMTICPIWFAMPLSMMLTNSEAHRQKKTRDIAKILPEQKETEQYRTEKGNYDRYEEAYYAITEQNSGFDSIRYYEMLARGCIPYFLNWNTFPRWRSKLLPRELLTQAMALTGLSQDEMMNAYNDGRIDTLQIARTEDWDRQYWSLQEEIMVWTWKTLTTSALAKYVLEKSGWTPDGDILFLSQPQVAYQSGLLWHGLNEVVNDQLYSDIQVRGYDDGSCCRTVDEEVKPGISKVTQVLDRGTISLIIYNKAGDDCDWNLEGWNLSSSVNSYLARYPNTKLVIVDGIDRDGCHDIPGFDRVDVVFRREVFSKPLERDVHTNVN